MNWAALLKIALQLVIPATHAIEAITTEAHSGADKKTLAVDAILQGANVAGAVLTPGDQAKADAISQLVAHSVDATVAATKLQTNAAGKVAAVVASDLPAAVGVIGIAQQAGV